MNETEQERNLHGQVLVLSKNSIVQLDVIPVNNTNNQLVINAIIQQQYIIIGEQNIEETKT